MKADVYLEVKNNLKTNQIPNELHEEIDYYSVKEKKPKNADQKHTSEITYDMLQEGKTIEEIAAIRKYVVGTIYGHIAKLIENGKLELKNYISEDKIKKMDELTKDEDFNVLTLNDLREKYDPEVTFSWEQLRMYKAGKVFEKSEKVE